MLTIVHDILKNCLLYRLLNEKTYYFYSIDIFYINFIKKHYRSSFLFAILSSPNNNESCQSSSCQNSYFSFATIPRPKYIFGISTGLFKMYSRYVNGEIVNAFFINA